MRNAILAVLLGTTTFAAGALAQQQPTVTPNVVPGGTVQAKAAIAECDRLEAYLEQARPANAGVTVDQVRTWRNTADPSPCGENLRRLTQDTNSVPPSPAEQAATSGAAPAPAMSAGGAPAMQPNTAQPGGTNATTALQTVPSVAPAPQAGGSGTAPQVVVQQAQPSVTVRQAQPEIIVRQAPPVITVQQPQPEIVVRMPQPDVNVAMQQPQVQVTMPQPRVQVVPPQAEAQPNVQAAGGQPNVRYERTGEPRIIYQPGEGQPNVRYESVQTGTTGAQPAPLVAQASPGAESTAQEQNRAASPNPQSVPSAALSPQGAQAQLNGAPATLPGYGTDGQPAAAPRPSEPAQTGALPGNIRQALKASDLEDRSVYNGRGEALGQVEELLMGADNKAYLLIQHGGFLGLGAKQVALAVDQFTLQGDRLVANLSDDELRALPEFKKSANFREVEDAQTAEIRVVR